MLVRLSLLLAVGAAAGCSEDLLAKLPDAGPACEQSSSNILFVNQSPATFRPGLSDSIRNESPILSEEVTVEQAALSDVEWQELMSCVRGILGPYAVEVTDVDPGEVDHIEIYVASDPELFGLPPTLLAVASAQCEPGPREVGFAFWQGDTRHLCEAGVGWSVGAITGLSFSYRCEDTMSALTDCGPKQFLDDSVECGQFGPEPCRCGGDTQNTHRHLLNFFGESECPAP